MTTTREKLARRLRTGIPWRKNVLTLVLAGYATVLFMFYWMVQGGGLTAEEAYNIVEAPLMAIVGGSLAISKDLIPFGVSTGDRDDEESENPNT